MGVLSVTQVVKCRVLNKDLSHQRLKLSLMGKQSNADGSAAEGSASGDPLGGLQPGDVIEGVVREVETAQVSIYSTYSIFDCRGQQVSTTCVVNLLSCLVTQCLCTLYTVTCVAMICA